MATNFVINTDSVLGPNTRFWQAAGDDLLFWLTHRDEGQDFLDRAQRTGSCGLLRNHHALADMYRHDVHLSAECYFEDEEGKPFYDFSFINSVYAEFVKRGIKPYVECDYFPAILGSKVGPTAEGTAAVENRLAGPRDWDKWRNLIKAFIENLITTFSIEEVRTWYIEVWNEPDGVPFEDFDVFCRMYDEFVDVVKGVDSQLKVGGPACFTQWTLQNFMHHVTKGTNHVTGKIGTPIDFISYHQYAMIGAWLDEHPLIRPCTQWMLHDLKWLSGFVERAGLGDVEFHINEWGVCNNYYRIVDDNPTLEYRNTEFSALFLIKLIHALFAIEDAYDFRTSVLLYWGTAWEGSFNRMFYGLRSLMTAAGVPKPIQTGFEMAARLGDERISVNGPGSGSSISLLATRTTGGAAGAPAAGASPAVASRVEFIVYNFDEMDDYLDDVQSVNIKIEGLDGRSAKANIYTMDDNHHNTYRAWQRQGSPKTAAETDIEALKREGELRPDQTISVPVNGGAATLSFELKDHTMHLCVLETEE